MELIILWVIVGAGLVGLGAAGLAVQALVQSVKGLEVGLGALGVGEHGEGGTAAEAQNQAATQELKRLNEALVNKENNIKTLLDAAEKLKATHAKETQEALEKKEAEIRQGYGALEAREKQLEFEVGRLKADLASAGAVREEIEKVAPYVYMYGDWYQNEAAEQKAGRETSALWHLCQGNQEIRAGMLDVFRYADMADRKQMYIQAAQLYETAYSQEQDATMLAETRENVEQLLAQLERGVDSPAYELRWPMVGTRWDENTARRLEENGQSTILAVVRPVVFDLKSMTVFSRGIVKTGS